MNRTGDDTNLIGRLQAGEQSAMFELYRTYGSKIFQLAMRYMKNKEDAEEVAQDVLLKVSRKIKAFRGDSALSSWIYRITFNTAMSRLRTVSFTRPAEVPEHALTREGENGAVRPRDPADWSSLPDEFYLRSQLRASLARAMSLLPAIYRTPVLLRDIHGLTTEEASEELKIKTQTLKSRLHRGRLALREHLAEFEGGLALHPAA